MTFTPEELQRLRFLKLMREDFLEFAARNLQVKAKDTKTVPFVLNTPQTYVHQRLEEQRAQRGRVRALVLKGRQQGISTYVGGRFYHKASLRNGVNVYIMAHAQDASDALFTIVDRYHRLNPLRPHTGASNVKELEFDKLDSSYAVGTAGAKAGGRGKTITLYHGSEVAFWNNAKDHFAASVQAVPDADGTEIILESTANGPAGEFYERWQDAEAGRSEYIAIFVPWFWSEEYARPDLVDSDFELSQERLDGDLSEAEYAEAYALSLAQMAWRRNKISELGHKLFKQEYPANAQEAFQTSQENSFIEAATVLRARKRKDVEGAGPLIFGVDPAGPGGDRFAVAARRGLKVEWIKWRDKIEALEANAWLKSLIDAHKPALVNIDAGGIGAATISLLRAEGPHYAKLVKAVNFGGTSEFKMATPKLPGPKNRRAEMWQRKKDWLELPEGVSIPDMDALQADMTAPMIKPTLTNDLLLESKDEMRKRGIRSPDLGDSVALTFATTRHIKEYHEPSRPVSALEPDMATRPAYVPRGGGGRLSWMR